MFNGIKDPKKTVPASSSPPPSRSHTRRSTLPADLRALLVREVGEAGVPTEEICERAVRHSFDARLHDYTDVILSETVVWYRSVDACQTLSRFDLSPPAPSGSSRRITLTLCPAMLFVQDGNVRGILVTHHVKVRRASQVTHETKRFFVSVRRMNVTHIDPLPVLRRHAESGEEERDRIEAALLAWHKKTRREAEEEEKIVAAAKAVGAVLASNDAFLEAVKSTYPSSTPSTPPTPTKASS